jgi:hypothetical protein
MKRIFQKLRKKSESPAGAPSPSSKEPSPAATTGGERRVAKRHAANVPAKMAYGFAGMPEPSQVKDINERGLFLYSVLPMAHGSTIEVELSLPQELAQPGKRRVRYSATVLRVEEKAGGELFGIAAAIKKCQILPDLPAPDETAKKAAKAAKSGG